MSKTNNPLAPKFSRLKNKSSQIKAWVREAVQIEDDTPITVAELACRDEGCPDLETVIGILAPGQPIKTLRVHAAMEDVTKTDVVEAVSASTSVLGV